MKTAEEFCVRLLKLTGMIDDVSIEKCMHESSDEVHKLITLVKEFQLDAWKQGMSDAAKIVEGYRFLDEDAAMSAKKEIESTCDRRVNVDGTEMI